MVAWDQKSVALAEELEVCKNGILFSFCSFSPIVSLFLPFFRFFFQFFQSCSFMASLFNPAVIMDPSTLLQDAS